VNVFQANTYKQHTESQASKRCISIWIQKLAKDIEA